jgi:hypothetical protein
MEQTTAAVWKVWPVCTQSVCTGPPWDITAPIWKKWSITDISFYESLVFYEHLVAA